MSRGPKQQGLFGPIDDDGQKQPRTATPDHVAACAHAAELTELAALLPDQLRLGTSSWMFPGWRGLVYADDAPTKLLSRLGLAAYSQHALLQTVGVDRTFYAPIATQDFADYAAQVPESFRFLVKAWGELTATTVRGKRGKNPRYLNPDCAIDDALTPAFEGLGDKLGCLLFQFPPQGLRVTKAPEAFADALHEFFAAMPKGVHYAVELRDAELLTQPYLQAIQAHSVQHCYCVHPRMPSLARQLELAPVNATSHQPITVRWMLHSGMRYEEAKEHYQPFDKLVDEDPSSRQTIAGLSVQALELNVPMTVVVNNKAEGSAPLSVLQLARAIVAAICAAKRH